VLALPVHMSSITTARIGKEQAVSARAPVSVDINGPILVVTLDRPKANAIDAATSRALYEAISLLHSDEKLRVAVVTAAGQRLFSAGWDLKAANGGETADADHGNGGFAGITELFNRTKPIIAAVNGSAYGGGVELMLAADLVVASEAATFSFPEARLGVLPDAGGVIRMAARLPRALAVELLVTGRSFTANEAHHWGLIPKLPRLAAVQAAGAAPFARSFEEGFARRHRVKADTVATAIKIGDPASYDRAVTAIRTTNGVVLSVQDGDLLEAKAAIDASGVGCEPASAASLAGVRELRRRGTLRADERVVAILTGNMLKDPGLLLKYHQEVEPPPAWANRPLEVEPSLSEIERVLRR